jgi:putative MATE family efflux protein
VTRSLAPTAVSSGRLLHGPMLKTLVQLAVPTVAVLFMSSALAVAETYFVSTLGVQAIAAASLVVPFIMLMNMVSSGGIGGGVSSAVARARGAGLPEEAESLVWHAVVIAVVAGVIFTITAWLAGPVLYRALGGSGRTLQLTLQYSNILFGGAIIFWILVLLQSALRGAGEVKIPALIMLGGVVLSLALSPGLILGWLGLPRLGVPGAGVAQVMSNGVALSVLVVYMRSSRASLPLKRHALRQDHFRAILGVGLPSTLNAIMSILSIAALTAAAGTCGLPAIAGYGIASRLELLLIPVMFGFGTAVITVVGTSLGAGDLIRARHAALVNAVFVAGLVEVVGLVVAFMPRLWIFLFSSDPAVTAVASNYLQQVGPVYAFIAITTELYFAGQGARRIGWPLTAGAVRLSAALAAATAVVLYQISLAFAFGIVAAGAVASGSISVFGFARVKWMR